MRYFRVRQDDRISNCATLSRLSIKDDAWDNTKDVFIKYEAVKPENAHFLPFIDQPILAVSEKVKDIFNNYQIAIEYKPFAMGNIEFMRVEPYYFMKPPAISCLDDKTVFTPTKEAKEIVLSRKKVGHNKIFQVDELKYNCLIVCLETVEALLSQDLNEFKFIEVKCEG